MITKHLPYWLAALHLRGVGPRKFLEWLTHFSTIESLFRASKDELLVLGLPPQHIASLQNPNWATVEKDLAWVQANDHHLICIEDERYPHLLKEIADPPLILYVRGDEAVLKIPQLAIVGSRHATCAGLKNAEYFAHTLVKRGIAITSGLAAGIDGASHRGALAAGGFTLAVLGTGLNSIYPRAHTALAQEIVSKQGAIISEFPLSTPPQAYNFPRRNRIISGLSLGVLIIEAALKSGSLITARHALEQGRDVFALPGNIHHPLVRGCHALIKQGAKLVESVEDILEELKFTFSTPSLCTKLAENTQNDLFNQLTAAERQVLGEIEYEITSLDMVTLRSGLTVGEVSSILLTLELHDLIHSAVGGYRRAIVK